ncbi:MAG: pyridoxal phosphate-dependent aminotransferase [Candidatus Dormibacteraeota bacterium]|nr:pyridoxal phosphate-dependent aminotransferase [Candidatus Dormibacteraeota bacterium]
MTESRFTPSQAVQRVVRQSLRPPLGPVHDRISLAAGDPDFETPAHVRDAVGEALDAGYTHYADLEGDPELVAAIAADLSRRTGVTWERPHVLITHGGTGGLAAAILGTVDPGDRVVLPEPTYSLYADLVALAGGEPVFCRLAPDFHLDLDAIEEAASGARLLLLCTPANPTGAVYRRSELEAVAEIAGRTGLLVLSDEAYDHIVYDGVEFASALDVPGLRDRLLYCQTFSKVLAMTGWRIGYLAGPQPMISAAYRVARTVNGPLNAFVQRAALTAFTTPSERPEQMRQEYQLRRDLVTESLDGVPGVSLRPPEGSFYALVRTDLGMTSQEVVEAAYERDVVIRAGTEFGPSGEGYVRLAFSTRRPELAEALSRLRDLFLELGTKRASAAQAR